MVQKINIYIQTNIHDPFRYCNGGFLGIIEYYAKVGDDGKEVMLKDPTTVSVKHTAIGMTSREAELEALIWSLGRLTKPCELTIFTDDAFIASALSNGWYKNWHDVGWIKADGKEQVADKEWWERLYESLKNHTIKEIKAAGTHSYKSWMRNELNGYKPTLQECLESLISSSCKSIEAIKRIAQPLEKSDIIQNSEVQKQLYNLILTCSYYMAENENEEISGVVKIENGADCIKLSYEEVEDSEKYSNLLAIT